jgi:hypothetical protein
MDKVGEGKTEKKPDVSTVNKKKFLFNCYQAMVDKTVSIGDCG